MLNDRQIRLLFKKIKSYTQQEIDEVKDRYKITMSEQYGKPYIVVDDMKQGGKTVFAGRLEHIQKNDLFKLN